MAEERLSTTHGRHSLAHGHLVVTNTLEKFKTADKVHLLSEAGRRVWESIVSGRAVDNPSLLVQFFLFTFADLKKYYFYYWFAFPALCPEDTVVAEEAVSIETCFNSKQMSTLQSRWAKLPTSSDRSFFLVAVSGDGVDVALLKDYETFCKFHPKFFVAFADPCTLEKHPGWPLRNLIMLLSRRWCGKYETVNVLCYRNRVFQGIHNCSHSIIIKVKLPTKPETFPKVVGWERNSKQKLGPQMVNMSSSMDPSSLAESAVDLNLKLMRWRLIPGLDLEIVAKTRCLLLGAGTLGCNVARCLLSWGVRNISFVDNGQVSYSNPVRQSLFQFDDCLNGGKPKALAAADGLKKIFPEVNANGYILSVPMPGHIVNSAGGEVDKVRSDVEKLEQLFDDNDVIFLLMDTREARWLPTVMAAAKGKMVINCALGFDTYLIMRHGVKQGTEAHPPHVDVETLKAGRKVPGSGLGCYFCNDVVAPGDSTKDRTLDQQCTVSRPGMSMLASALAVELLVSLLQHPSKGLASADTTSKDSHLEADFESTLGLVPHQIRGFLSRFYSVMPASLAFDKCAACSDVVVSRYLTEGFHFLLQVFNSPTFLEEVTGLSQLHAEAVEDEIWAISDDEI